MIRLGVELVVCAYVASTFLRFTLVQQLVLGKVCLQLHANGSGHRNWTDDY